MRRYAAGIPTATARLPTMKADRTLIVSAPRTLLSKSAIMTLPKDSPTATHRQKSEISMYTMDTQRGR